MKRGVIQYHSKAYNIMMLFTILFYEGMLIFAVVIMWKETVRLNSSGPICIGAFCFIAQNIMFVYSGIIGILTRKIYADEKGLVSRGLFARTISISWDDIRKYAVHKTPAENLLLILSTDIDDKFNEIIGIRITKKRLVIGVSDESVSYLIPRLPEKIKQRIGPALLKRQPCIGFFRPEQVKKGKGSKLN